MRILVILFFFISTTIGAQVAAYRIHEEGQKLFNEGKYAEAIAKFDATIKADATYFEAYCDRARANMALGKNDLAKPDLDKCIQLNPKYAPGFFYRAQWNQQNGKDEDAIKDYTSAWQLNPDLSEALLNRAILNRKKNPADPSVLNDLNLYIIKEPKKANGYYQRALYYIGMKKENEALKDLNQAITIDPNNRDAYYQRGLIDHSQKNYNNAIADLSKAITLGKNDTDVYRARAFSYEASGKIAEAIADYSKLIEVLKSRDTDLYRRRGELYMAQANYTYAIRDFNKGLGFRKEDVALLYDRALCYYKQGKTKFPLAEVDLKKILSLDGKNVSASRLLAQLYFDQEKWQDALDAINVAIKNSASGDDYDLRGKCNYKLNNKKGACEDLTKAETMGCKTAAQDKLNAGCR